MEGGSTVNPDRVADQRKGAGACSGTQGPVNIQTGITSAAGSRDLNSAARCRLNHRAAANVNAITPTAGTAGAGHRDVTGPGGANQRLAADAVITAATAAGHTRQRYITIHGRYRRRRVRQANPLVVRIARTAGSHDRDGGCVCPSSRRTDEGTGRLSNSGRKVIRCSATDPRDLNVAVHRRHLGGRSRTARHGNAVNTVIPGTAGPVKCNRRGIDTGTRGVDLSTITDPYALMIIVGAIATAGSGNHDSAAHG